MIKYEEVCDDVLYEQIDPDYKTNLKVVKIEIKENQIYTHVPKHWHRSIEIIVPINGITEAWVEGNIYNVNPNDFLIINSKEIHSCRGSMPMQNYLGYALQIKYDFIKSCFENIDCYYFDRNCKVNHNEINDLLKKIVLISSEDNELKYLKIQSLVYELVYLLLYSNCFKKKTGYTIKSLKQKNKLIEILTYLDATSDENLDVQKLSDYFHLSYGYIANLFKTYLNMTIGEYINSVRIRKIEKDLILTDKSIIDICMAHGFANKKSFYREFNKYHDCSPTEYRRSAKYEK